MPAGRSASDTSGIPAFRIRLARSGADGATGAATAEYIWLEGMPLAFITGGAVYFVHTDHLGTPQRLTDGSKAVVWDASYAPFGGATVSGSVTFNLRFPGQYEDAETGLHYNYFRDYDPALGRYVQSDPIGLRGGWNTFAYVGGNPLAYFDPFGLRIVGNWVQYPQFAGANVTVKEIELSDLGVRIFPPAISLALVTLDIEGIVQGVVYCREISDNCDGKTIRRWIETPTGKFEKEFQAHVPYRVGPPWWTIVWIVIDSAETSYRYRALLRIETLKVARQLMKRSATAWCILSSGGGANF